MQRIGLRPTADRQRVMLQTKDMLNPRWTYSNKHGLTEWYGHVDYYGEYIIGQWFVLDANTGAEYWSRRYFRPNSVCGCAHDVIVANEIRSDGPWTYGFGIYGIDARTGLLLWTNHARGLWGKLLRFFDYVPSFTNGSRDRPDYLVDQYIVTTRGRILDIRTGLDCPSSRIPDKPEKEIPESEHKCFDNGQLEINGDMIELEGSSDDFVILRRDKLGRYIWRFAAKDHFLYVDWGYYSVRFQNDHIFIIAGDAPHCVPINENDPSVVKSNPANYSMVILDATSGEHGIFPLANAIQREKCRIESMRNSRILVSCDGIHLAEYDIAT